MRVLGIDPGVGILGWSFIASSSSTLPNVQYGCIRTSSLLPLTKRLLELYDGLKEIIEREMPEVIALETLFFVKNAKTLAQVGHMRGVILLLAGQYKLEAHEYAPRQIKMALTGFGGADKRQMQLMVQRMLHLKEIPRPDDAADAVAVAMCHLQFSTSYAKSALTV